MGADLFLLVIEFLPLGTEKLADLAKPSIWVLGLDPLAPVLGEEHVG